MGQWRKQDLQIIGMSTIRVKQSGTNVLLLLNGVVVAEMPWQAALDVGNAFRSVGKLAEQEANPHRTIADHALLIRAGIPIGLSNHPRMIAEACKEAAWNRDLRRYMPSIKSREVFGAPRISNIMRKP